MSHNNTFAAASVVKSENVQISSSHFHPISSSNEESDFNDKWFRQSEREERAEDSRVELVFSVSVCIIS